MLYVFLVEPSVKGSSTHHICGIPPDLGKFHDFTSNQFEINQLVITLMTFFFRIVTDIVTDQQGRFFFQLSKIGNVLLWRGLRMVYWICEAFKIAIKPSQTISFWLCQL